MAYAQTVKTEPANGLFNGQTDKRKGLIPMLEITPALEVTTPADFAAWLAEHGATTREIWPIIYKKSSGKQTVTYPQLVEVGICYGWIDVLEKTVDSERYAIRFMPRRRGGNWTEANRALARRFIAEGRMTEAGKAALPLDL